MPAAGRGRVSGDTRWPDHTRSRQRPGSAQFEPKRLGRVVRGKCRERAELCVCLAAVVRTQRVLRVLSIVPQSLAALLHGLAPGGVCRTMPRCVLAVSTASSLINILGDR